MGSRARIAVGALNVVVVAVLACALALAWSWYRSGPLVDAQRVIKRGWTEDEVRRLLGNPSLRWKQGELKGSQRSYPVPGYGKPPAVRFHSALANFSRDKLLYVYLDRNGRVVSTFLSGG